MMRLADLQRATELQATLERLDEYARRPILQLELSGAEIAEFVAWRRGLIHRQLRALGIEPEGEQDRPAGPQSRPTEDADGSRGTSAASETLAIAGVLSRADAVAEARRRVLAGPAQDLAEGRIDKEKFEQFAAHRHDQIDATVRALGNGAPDAQCEDCGDMATTTIAGRALCATHAATAPRPERPTWLRRALA